MNERVKKLAEQANKLSPSERADLVEGILQSLDASVPRLDNLWPTEAEDRLTAFRRGEIASVDFDAIVKAPETSDFESPPARPGARGLQIGPPLEILFA